MKRQFILIVIILLVSLTSLSAYGENELSNERILPRLVDEAALLTDQEASKLIEKLDGISEKQKMDIVIITVDSLEGYGPRELADNIYEYNGFGFGPNNDGILLLLSMEERDWAISTGGYGITAFTDAGQGYMTDNFIKYLSKGDYYKGFEKFANLADDFIDQARTNMPYDTNNLPKKSSLTLRILIGIIGGGLIGFIVTSFMKSSLKSVSKERVASKYLVASSMLPLANNDLYLYSTVSKTERKKEDDSSGGGSTTRTSSSGKSHGGSSGKF